MATRPIVNIKLTRDNAAKPTALESWILSAVSSYKDDEVLVFWADGENLPNTEQAFSHITPRDDGTFEVEVGIPLPHWLPDMNGSQEYTVGFTKTNGSVRTLCVSNQMIKLLYVVDGHQYQAILPRRLWGQAQEILKIRFANVPIAPLKTVVTSRFILHGATAHAALEAEIDGCIDELFDCLNELAITNVSVNERAFSGFLSPKYDKSSIDAAYFIMRGSSMVKFANWRIGTSLTQALLRPTINFSSTEEHKVRSVLGGTGAVDDITRLIQVARAYLESGLLEFAFLQLVIAAEMATARYVHKTLIANGVSKTKLGESTKELTFSMMLNLHVVALAPPSKKPDFTLLGKINEARRRRNELMHEGIFDARKEYLRELYTTVRTYVAYLGDIQAQPGSATSEPSKAKSTKAKSTKAKSIKASRKTRSGSKTPPTKT